VVAAEVKGASIMLDAEMRHQRYAVLAAVVATAILALALLNRISVGGPCAFNSFQRSAVCVQALPLPADIPDNTQTRPAVCCHSGV